MESRGFVKNLFLVFLIIGFIGSGFVLLWAASFQIPDLKTFDERKVAQSTKIYDRTGEILLFDVHKDIQRTVIPLEKISRHIKNATIAIEDAEFYKHFGIKPKSILRAIFVNIFALGFEQGGSTITQQVVKNSLLTPEKRISRKLKEWALAIKLEKVVSKDRILELYLNEVPYGGNIYGVEEASRSFFDKSASELTLAEAAYLAALPQAPTYYSPYGNNVDKLDERKNLILKRMSELDFIPEEDYNASIEEDVLFQPKERGGIKAPHFVFYVIEQLEKKYGREVVEAGGLKITTTLDYSLQSKAEDVIARFAESNKEKFNANNAGLIAIDPKTGGILVMVGSKDYFDSENDGNFNVTISPNRQPGSAFKPFVYATVLMKGYTPETIVFDLETQFHSECDSEGKPLEDSVDITEDDCYTPSNYDDIFRGPVTLRNALAQSINIPSIKVLYLAGLQDSLRTARAMGISSLDDVNRFGLTLVLGGGEVSLLEMTSAYSVFANEGVRNKYNAILKIEETNGNVLEEYKPQPERVLPKSIALQVTDILSDNDARAPAFGQRSYLYFEGKDVGVKTGTTNDYRDAWIIGYTPNIAVGTWAGNNDNTSMEKKVAGFIVAPMWNEFMREVFKERKTEYFKPFVKTDSDGLKPILRGIWHGGISYFIDSYTNKLATEYTPEETKKEKILAQVHSILYWIDKSNPNGEQLEEPEKDSQFTLWEDSVRKWVEEKNIQEETEEDIPTEYDSVHKPEFFPTITISNFDEGYYNPVNNRVSFNIEGTGKFPLTRVDVFVNNIYIGSSKTKPFNFSFIPKELNIIKTNNTIRVVGYDIVMNSNSIEKNLKIRF